MGTPGLVSVVMAAYNCGDFIGEAIDFCRFAGRFAVSRKISTTRLMAGGPSRRWSSETERRRLANHALLFLEQEAREGRIEVVHRRRPLVTVS
jgi:hypothetical protein